MIKTTELMIGNIIELNDKYVIVDSISQNRIGYRTVEGKYNDTDSNYINPIPLTEVLIKRLGINKNTLHKTVHGFQNYSTVSKFSPLDITPLLSPRYITHDGVEVWEGDKVWYCYISGTRSKNETDSPNSTVAHEGIPTNKNYYYFSTQQACQSYIDSVTRKPIFTTEDGVEMFEGDKYWYCYKSGFNKMGNKDDVTGVNAYNTWRSIDDNIRFSTHELAQAYLNKVWAEKEYNDLISKK